jgi:H+/Cl- antiporter ClcA
MKKSTFFLVLTWVTVAVLLASTYPIFLDHKGFDIVRFAQEINVNSSVRFLGADLSLMGLSFAVWMYLEGTKLKIKRWWLPFVGVFLVGIAVIVPWFLYLREKHLESK